MVHVEKFTFFSLDDLCSNSYIVSDSNNKCVIVDPSVDNGSFTNYIAKNKLEPVAILLTHGHFDHIRGVEAFLKSYNVPIYLHPLDEIMLANSKINGAFLINKEIAVKHQTTTIEDNEILHLLEDDIKVIHTPYHTKGSVCYYLLNNKLLFTGDTLFKYSIGRDDLPNADTRSFSSTYKKIMPLPRECKVYPGHGSNTTLDDELNHNCFLSQL